jgi:hypothetical protein
VVDTYREAALGEYQGRLLAMSDEESLEHADLKEDDQ